MQIILLYAKANARETAAIRAVSRYELYQSEDLSED